ncbi:MAG: MerR family transcriptional regulator [Bacilli bacterium]|nr:MerR family transcriptional regulator [Bacilli bacterium]
MLKIGEFSKLTGIPIRTLRYYDEIDLFKPADIDLFTDYRYYSEEQVDDLNLINELKKVGFSLEEIKTYWNNFTDEIMLKKKEELIHKIDDINESVKNIDILRSNIHNGKITKNIKTKNTYVKSLY